MAARQRVDHLNAHIAELERMRNLAQEEADVFELKAVQAYYASDLLFLPPTARRNNPSLSLLVAPQPASL